MNEEWAWWRYDLANTGHTPVSGPERDVRARWTYDAGYGVPGTPVVADGTVHVATMNPHMEPNLHGIRAETGERRYETAGDDPFSELRGSPTVVGSTAYVVVLDTPPLLRGYDVDTGERVCEYDVGALSRDGTPPLFAADVCYCTFDWSVVAVGVDGGGPRWTYAPGETYGAPALVDDTLYVGGADRDDDGPPIDLDEENYQAELQYPSLHAVDAATGEREWACDLDVVPRTVAVADDTAFCCGKEPYARHYVIEDPVGLDGGLPTYGMVQAVSLDGEPRWTAELEARVATDPGVADGTVVVGTDAGESGDAGCLVALDAETGDRRWTHETGGRWATPSVGDDVVYAGNREGFVDAVALDDGSHLWRFETGGGVDGPPSVADGRVYVGDSDGQVYALETA